MRTAVLISGRGSNMKALVKASRCQDAQFDVVQVISNRPKAEGVDFARAAGINVSIIDHKDYDDHEAFETVLDQGLRQAHIDVVCLAGFMRILSPWFVKRWQNKLLNIHPSLLPAFKGLHTHERALEAGVRFHGCSVHFVTAELDDGPILVQGIVPVSQDDTPQRLAERVLVMEHRCYPHALSLIASGRVHINNNRATIDHATTSAITLMNPES